MTWQLFLFISIVTTSITILLQRLLAEENNDPIAYSIAFQFFVGALIFVYGLIFGGLNFSGILNFWPNLILMVILYGGFNILVFTSLRNIEASEFTILLQTRTIWTIIFSMLILQEAFSFKNAVGTFLILGSVFLVTEIKGKIKFKKAELLTLLAALGFGLAFVNDAFIIKHVSLISYLVVSFTLPSLVIMAVFPKSIKNLSFLKNRQTARRMLFASFFYAAAAITTFAAYRLGTNISIISPLSQTATILTVLLAIIFLNERDYLNRKLLAALVSFIGVLLLI